MNRVPVWTDASFGTTFRPDGRYHGRHARPCALARAMAAARRGGRHALAWLCAPAARAHAWGVTA